MLPTCFSMEWTMLWMFSKCSLNVYNCIRNLIYFSGGSRNFQRGFQVGGLSVESRNFPRGSYLSRMYRCSVSSFHCRGSRNFRGTFQFFKLRPKKVSEILKVLFRNHTSTYRRTGAFWTPSLDRHARLLVNTMRHAHFKGGFIWNLETSRDPPLTMRHSPL